jgi:hypothetical protein
LRSSRFSTPEKAKKEDPELIIRCPAGTSDAGVAQP